MDAKIFFCVLVSLLFVLVGSSEFEPTLPNPITEQPDQKVGITTSDYSELGAREYLETNLVGLHNMAMTYLPQTLNYINIIEAFREVIDGVRYELLVNTTNMHNEEYLCRLVVQEKPWLITVWNEKYRELIFSNCSSSTADINNNVNPTIINNKYKSNTLFDNQNTDLTSDQLSDLESQILQPTATKQKVIVNNAIVNNEFIVRVPDELPVSCITTVETLIEPEIEKKTDDRFAKTSTNINVNNNVESSTLSEDDKYFLDNFFSFYAFGANDDDNTQKKINQAEEQLAGDNSEINSANVNAFVETQKAESIAFSSNTEFGNNERTKRSTPKYNDAKNERLFEKFQLKYNKNYQTSMERQIRYQAFKSNLIKINTLNKMEQGTAKYGITEFTDMTPSEYQMRKGFLINDDENRISNPLAEIPDIKLPKAFDWRKHGAVSEVKNQGSCGSCWAFSVTGNIEGLYAIKTGQLEEFSEQELIDCDTIDKGCGGGLPDDAYKAIENIGGLEFESEYPYLGRSDKCNFNKTLSHVQVKSAVDLPKNETAMALWLLANGPISIGINANAMQFYRGGISHPWKLLCRASDSSLDHGVLIVGFGVDEFPMFKKTLPYWIVKNSWGPSWGEQGYYRVYRGDNTCGISNMATSAVI